MVDVWAFQCALMAAYLDACAAACRAWSIQPQSAAVVDLNEWRRAHGR